MAYRDHIGITSGNKSTTRAYFSVAECPGCSADRRHSQLVFRYLSARRAKIREYCPVRRIYAQFRRVSPGGERDPRRRSPVDTDGNLPWSNREIRTYLTLYTTIVRSSPSVNR